MGIFRTSDVSARRSCALAALSLLALAGCAQDKVWEEAYAEPTDGLDANGAAQLDAQVGIQEGDFFDPFAVSSTGGDAPITSTRQSEADALYGETMTNAFATDPEYGRFLGDTSVAQASFSLAGADFDPDVSPDGEWIVFASTQHKHTADIYVKNARSRAVSQLTSASAHEVMPKFSPDGKRIAFASNKTGSWDIFVMPASGGRAVQITSTSAHDLHPSWSPDGRHLVFCRLGEVSGKWELWVTDVNNTGVQQFIGYGLFPEWCPAPGTGMAGADQILFQRSRERGDRAFSVWTIDYQDGTSGQATEVASSPVAACINPTWSPDGEWVVFATVPNPNEWKSSKPQASDLWLASLRGHGRVNLTSSHTVDLMPVWGDDNRIFYVSDRGGIDNIWQVDAGQAILAATGEAPKGTPSVTQAPNRSGTLRAGNDTLVIDMAGVDDGQ